MNNDEVPKLAEECGIYLSKNLMPNLLNFISKIRAKDAELIKAISDAHIAAEQIIAQQNEGIKQLHYTIGEEAKYSGEVVLKLSATKKRGAMLVEALRKLLNGQDSERVIQQAKDTLSNSTEHTNKWLAEHDAKVLEEYADELYSLTFYEASRELRRMANELRSK